MYRRLFLQWLVLIFFALISAGCETVKGAYQGAWHGAKKDVRYVTEAVKGETEEPKGLGRAVDAVKKTDQWIKDNMW